MNDILVSINCTAYNHEKYIAEAIESFLMQKTNFKYEILIHDDASTDRTADIIKEYQEKYPDIVKPILQKENQYSKGNKRVWAINNKRAKGKYVAICEGDDYWTDPLKLQKQVDFMENHPECSMCFHAAIQRDATNRRDLGFIRPFNKTFILPEDKLFLGGGNFCPSASILFIKKLMENAPDFYFKCSVGDNPFALIISNQGRIGYINEVMSVRNLWVPNSWSTIHHENTKENKIKHVKEMITLLEEYNDYSNKKCEYDLNKNLLAWNIQLLSLMDDLKPLKNANCKKLIKKLNLLDKIKFYSRILMPKLYNAFINIRVNLRKNILKIQIENSGTQK